MAIVNVLSAQLTNRDAVPLVPEDPRIANSAKRTAKAIVAITNGDNIGSTYRLFTLPARAVLQSLKVSSPDIGTTTTADFGLYRTTKNGGAVVDADFFTAALSLKDGAIARSEILNGNIISLSKMETLLKDQTGPASYTDSQFDVVATLTGDADAGGTIFVEAEFTEG